MKHNAIGEIKLSKATIRDFDGLFDLLQNHLWPNENLNKLITKSIIDKQIKNGKLFIIAKLGNSVVGMGSLVIGLDIQNQAKTGTIDELVVHRDYRSKNMGKILLSEIFKIAEINGLVEVQLHSSFKRKKAHKFYKKLGFNKTAYFFWKEI